MPRNSIVRVRRHVRSVLPESALVVLRAGTGKSLLTRETIARTYLRGEGIEIGALHRPLPVPKNARVKYVDRVSRRELANQYPELDPRQMVDVDIVSDGETLDSVADESQDFVIANHFLEHCQNPILAVENMLRVLRLEGIAYLAVPD
jgi:hypothetical protein